MANKTVKRVSKRGKAAAPSARGGALSSMIGNLRSLSGSRYNADMVKFFLRRLRQEIGISEQALMCMLIMAGFETSPLTNEFREKLRREWQESNPGASESPAPILTSTSNPH